MLPKEEVELLKRQRSAYKGQITQFKNQLSSASTLGGYESILRRIQIVYDKYNGVQLKLELELGDESDLNDRQAFEEEYGNLETDILNLIHDLKKAEASVHEISFHNASVTDGNKPSDTPTIPLRLPELKHPTFSGEDKEWLAFRDIFQDLIHNKAIDPTMKFAYLISHIRAGAAYNLIESIPVTAANYPTAWKIICDRYDNSLEIQRIHMKQLYDVKPPQENSSRSLQLFIEHIVKHYNALKSLKIEVDKWDLMLVHHFLEKLDNLSRMEVIRYSDSTKLLSFNDLIKILKDRVRILGSLKPSTSSNSSNKPRQFNHTKTKSSTLLSHNHGQVSYNQGQRCSYCKDNHSILSCASFCDHKITPQMRFQFIRNQNLCTNCLVERHLVNQCKGGPCEICSLKHNKLLHFNQNHNKTNIKYNSERAKGHHQTSVIPEVIKDSVSAIASSRPFPDASNKSTQQGSLSASVSHIGKILLGTALINAQSSTGNILTCRALLDSGSHLNFITQAACQMLSLKKHNTNKIISGIGGQETSIKHKVYLQISSRVSDFTATLEFLVIPKITNQLPIVPVDFDINLISQDMQLADPLFHVPDKIDILIGAEIYNQLFDGKTVTVSKELPSLFGSVFGYIVTGKVNNVASLLCMCSTETVDVQIKKFWELETITSNNNYSIEQKRCEEHYSKTYQRLPSGRYSVALPVTSNIDNLGSTCDRSLKQFLAIEKRLLSQREMYSQYQIFMQEYISLGHMREVKSPELIKCLYNKLYYLPHHYILKENSLTTKLRVVFNASSKSSTQISLNDCLMVGPTVQQSLFAIILRFRKHIVAFSGDITKMYRQIQLHENQQDLQRIWWRNSISEPIKCYNLCSVTYGTASAPYLATRTLKQLSLDEANSYPLASEVLANDFYVDDVLTGSSDLKEAILLKSKLIALLKLGGFELTKFSSNYPELSSHLDSSSQVSLILGLSWDTLGDNFEVSFTKFKLDSPCTKRAVLSEICQLFDPLGICAPITLTAKLIMQSLWVVPNLGWDDSVPGKIYDKWYNFKRQIIKLNKLSVSRCIITPQTGFIELHGFGDASDAAYGCVIYTRIIDRQGNTFIKLVCAKSKVAPLKKQTIPRLELCAALLLAQTVNMLLESLKIQFHSIYLWTDSEITLFRIKSEPYKFTTFVANRITQIQELSSANDWYYVPTKQNPADYVSRGLMPEELLHEAMWWSGPTFLTGNKSYWPTNFKSKLSLDILNLEFRKIGTNLLSTAEQSFDIYQKFSSLTKLLRVTAYVIRFIENLKFIKHNEMRRRGSLTSMEIDPALKRLVKNVQYSKFKSDIECINKKQYIRNSSVLKSLSPIIDQHGVLRVGGRLSNATINYNQKHQIILSGKHILAKLLTRHEHERCLHCGPQALLYNLRMNYWITGGRNLCKQVVSQCIRCFRTRPQIINQIMGDLPKDRVTPSRPFSKVGIDFCGPFYAKPKGRSRARERIYVCIFICFVVKAVHLDIVMDLSSQAFISCLRRFIARRGICSKIYSDNATNFVGARSDLKELRELFLSEACQNETKNFCANNLIEWSTIPPRSPHFDGLWEAAVKSAKFHMKRVIGTNSFTLEEYYTLLAQIEASLNSPPLTAMSNDPSDLTPLSPGHFLIGEPLLSLPEPSLLDINSNRLSRYQLIQMKFQDFWKRWHVEYLAELQHRYKWQKSVDNVKIDSLVLLHEDNIPPINWVLGRIVEVHRGSDNSVRVVTVKTKNSLLKRAINKITVLPIETTSLATSE